MCRLKRGLKGEIRLLSRQKMCTEICSGFPYPSIPVLIIYQHWLNCWIVRQEFTDFSVKIVHSREVACNILLKSALYVKIHSSSFFWNLDSATALYIIFLEAVWSCLEVIGNFKWMVNLWSQHFLVQLTNKFRLVNLKQKSNSP